jgi:hypothetical protein
MKNRTILKYFGFTLLVIVVTIIFDASRGKAVDWSYSYSQKDKIPYGTYVLYDLLPELFPEQKIQTAQRPPYSVLVPENDEVSNYIVINERFEPDPASLKALLKYVARGNRLFLAAEQYGRQLSDTLGFRTQIRQSFSDSCFFSFNSISDTDSISATGDSVYRLRPGDGVFSFSLNDSMPSTILAVNGQREPCLIEIPFGKGRIFLATIPASFCNYYLLFGNTADFVFRAFAFLPVRPTVWDEYFKVANTEVQTPMRFILSTAALKWAYYLFIFSIILFIIFQGRRRQRIIPVASRPVNRTIAFIGTIARLYLKTGNHRILAKKKMAHLSAFLRSRYHIKYIPDKREELNAIAQRTSIPCELLEKLLLIISEINGHDSISNARLAYINEFVDAFYERVKG